MGGREAGDGATGRTEAMLARASGAPRPSLRVAFRDAFSPAARGDLLELLRDVAALANSGGGAVVVGVRRDGTPSGWDPGPLLATGTSELADAFAHHLGEPPGGLAVRSASRAGAEVAVIVVPARTGSPLVFEQPGTYEDERGGEHTAFERGTIYFRHGTRSEPASAADVRRFTSREVQRQRREWNRNVRKVAAAPAGARVVVMKPRAAPGPDLVAVRVVEDADAPAFARADFDVTHPYRQTEIVRAFNERTGGPAVTAYDIQCVRRVHAVDAEPRFFHVPKFGSPQYSEAFVSWLLEEYARDPAFFEHAKQRVHELRVSARASSRPGDAGGNGAPRRSR